MMLVRCTFADPLGDDDDDWPAPAGGTKVPGKKAVPDDCPSRVAVKHMSNQTSIEARRKEDQDLRQKKCAIRSSISSNCLLVCLLVILSCLTFGGFFCHHFAHFPCLSVSLSYLLHRLQERMAMGKSGAGDDSAGVEDIAIYKAQKASAER